MLNLTDTRALLASLLGTTPADEQILRMDALQGVFSLQSLVDVVELHASAGLPVGRLLLSTQVHDRFYPEWKTRVSYNSSGEPFVGTARVISFGHERPLAVFLYDTDAEMPLDYAGPLATVVEVFMYDPEHLDQAREYATLTLKEGERWVSLAPDWLYTLSTTQKVRGEAGTREESLHRLYEAIARKLYQGITPSPNVSEADVIEALQAAQW